MTADAARNQAAGPCAGRAPVPAELLRHALAWLELDVRARAVVDDRLGILWANAPAAAELARRRDLENRDGALATVERRLQRELATFVAGCGPELADWSFPRADGDGRLIVRAQRIGDLPEGAAAYGLFFHGSGSEFRPRFAGLERAFNLTAGEHRVLLDLIEGCPADAIAEQRGVSVETVRSHIRHIYAKMGVASREALFFRVRPYRL